MEMVIGRRRRRRRRRRQVKEKGLSFHKKTGFSSFILFFLSLFLRSRGGEKKFLKFLTNGRERETGFDWYTLVCVQVSPTYMYINIVCVSFSVVCALRIVSSFHTCACINVLGLRDQCVRVRHMLVVHLLQRGVIAQPGRRFRGIVDMLPSRHPIDHHQDMSSFVKSQVLFVGIFNSHLL